MQQAHHRLTKPLHRRRQLRPKQGLQVHLMLVGFIPMNDGLLLFPIKMVFQTLWHTEPFRQVA
jgi:hypothetical protein